MERKEIAAMAELFAAASFVTLEVSGKRIGLGVDMIKEITVALMERADRTLEQEQGHVFYQPYQGVTVTFADDEVDDVCQTHHDQ